MFQMVSGVLYRQARPSDIMKSSVSSFTRAPGGPLRAAPAHARRGGGERCLSAAAAARAGGGAVRASFVDGACRDAGLPLVAWSRPSREISTDLRAARAPAFVRRRARLEGHAAHSRRARSPRAQGGLLRDGLAVRGP